MDYTVLTIFPEMFDAFWAHGIVRRALEAGHITAGAINIRNYAQGRHKVTDDRPYGGGCGMVMKPEPLAAAIGAAREKFPAAMTVMLTPQGRKFDQAVASELSRENGLILVCGRYEGVDERICGDHIDLEISIGDYVLTGGEVAAMAVIDAVTRLLPGVLGNEDSARQDSFARDLLEHGHYTRPPSFNGESVPEVLLSGNHSAIEKWRHEYSLVKTFLKRPDLLKDRTLDKVELEILKKWRNDLENILRSKS
jgi:tRNA (guanine37-N1)-methyltransferase